MSYTSSGETPPDIIYEFNNIQAEYKGKKVTKILKGISGYALSGQALGIMGGSGAGKTTFLNILTGFIPKNLSVTGTISLNGQPRKRKEWPFQIGIVEQKELLYMFQTVGKSIKFVQKFHYTNNGPTREITRAHNQNEREKLLQDLGLGHVENNLLVRISGGELRRIFIGLEVLSCPKILLLDEPTTGLDSLTARNIVTFLKEIAVSRNIAIIMTLHQPRVDILETLDRFFILSQGYVMFDGSLKESINYFGSLGYPVPEKANPLGYFIDIVSLEVGSNEMINDSATKRFEFFRDSWNSQPPKEICSSIVPYVPLVNNSKILTEIRLLIRRGYSSILHNTTLVLVYLFQLLSLWFLLSFTFLQIGNTQEAIQSYYGLLLFIMLNIVFMNAIPMFNFFPSEKVVIQKERRNLHYRGVSAYLGKFLSEFPLRFCFQTIFYASMYWIVGLKPTASAFFIFLTGTWLGLLFSLGFGLLVSSFSPTHEIAHVMGNTGILFFAVYSGTLCHVSTIPWWLSWMIWISPLSYLYKALFQNQFQGLTFICTEGDIGCITTGEEVIEMYLFGYPSILACYMIFLSFTVVTIIGGIIMLEIFTTTRFVVDLKEKKEISDKLVEVIRDSAPLD